MAEGIARNAEGLPARPLGDQCGKRGDQDQAECEHGRAIPRLRGNFPDGERL
jgi:hypothetical protein